MASYVAPALRDKFETLSVDLKNCILERNVSHQKTIFIAEQIFSRLCYNILNDAAHR